MKLVSLALGVAVSILLVALLIAWISGDVLADRRGEPAPSSAMALIDGSPVAEPKRSASWLAVSRTFSPLRSRERLVQGIVQVGIAELNFCGGSGDQS